MSLDWVVWPISAWLGSSLGKAKNGGAVKSNSWIGSGASLLYKLSEGHI